VSAERLDKGKKNQVFLLKLRMGKGARGKLAKGKGQIGKGSLISPEKKARIFSTILNYYEE